MPRGGARPGAGRKPKALAEKVANGNPGGRPLKRVEFAGQSAESKQAYMAPDFLKLMDKGVPGIPSPVEIFNETVDYLRPSGCLHLMPVLLLGDYVMAKYHLLIAQYTLSRTGIITQDDASKEVYITPFTEAMLKLQKNALSTWQPIWDIVSRNSQTLLDNPEEELMAYIMGARKRRNQSEGEPGYEATRNPFDPGA
jgi:hypothetical protein